MNKVTHFISIYIFFFFIDFNLITDKIINFKKFKYLNLKRLFQRNHGQNLKQSRIQF